MALVFTTHVKMGRQRLKETDPRTKLLVLQAMKVRARNGVVTLTLPRELHLTHHILVFFLVRHGVVQSIEHS